MLNRLLHGFLFGIGFAVAVALVLTVHSLFVLPTIVMAKFEEPRPASIDGDPAEVVPVGVNPHKSERKFELHKESQHSMQIPPGGGILSLAITGAPEGSERPSTIQAWITKGEAFLIETTGEIPTVKKVPYPKSDPAYSAGELVREYAGFREENMTTTVSASEVRDLKNGATTGHTHLNGVLRITSEGIVFFVPGKFGP